MVVHERHLVAMEVHGQFRLGSIVFNSSLPHTIGMALVKISTFINGP